jgi:putative ABC transport system permease protein
VQDFRFALRSLRKNPGFAAVAIFTLALGIGANTAIFTLVDTVLIRPLPFRDSDRLVRVTGEFSKQGVEDVGLGVAELLDYRDHAGVFDDIAGIFPINANLTGTDEPERVEGQLVSANYFTLLGVSAALGRVFDQTDYQPGNAEVAVLSDSLWKRRFGADRSVIGRKLRLDNDLFEIVGVLPPSFHHPGRVIQGEPEIFSPSGYIATPFSSTPQHGANFLGGAIARLKPGVTLEAARTRLETMGAAMRAEYPKAYPDVQGWRPRIIPLQEDLVGRVQHALMVLLAAVAAVLLIACANVANLLLARASARQREFAIRGALGATRGRLVAQLLTESLALSLAGGIAGVLVAQYLLRALTTLVPEALPRSAAIGIDARILGFSMALSLVTTLVFGLWPALQASPGQVYDTLKESGRAVAGGARSTRVRGFLVVGEFALSLVLLVTASLLVRSLVRLYAVDTGFATDGVLTARLWMPQPNDPSTGPYFAPERRMAFYKESLEKIRTIPGVEHAAWVTGLPLTGGRGNASFMIEGRPAESAGMMGLDPKLATPDYFETLRIGLVRGRVFSDHDDLAAPPVVVIGESLARKYFPDEDPIGRRVRGGGPSSTGPWLTIVGIVRDVRSVRLDTAPTLQIYRCIWQAASLSAALAVKTSSAPEAFGARIRAAVRATDPELPLYAVQPMRNVVESGLAERRFSMLLIGVFAAFALVLSSVGIYGVLAYLVEQRTAEIGVRMAIGAKPRSILRLIIMQGLWLAAAGILIGLAGAALAARAISGLLFGVDPLDPATFAGAALLLTVVAALACYVPARRATRIDPLVALRQE